MSEGKLTASGWPRPVVGGLPIPWVSPADDLSTMNAARAAACASGAVCAVCGVGYDEGQEAFAFVRGEALPADMSTGTVRAMDNAIMHGRCARLALAVCPKLKSLVAGGLLQIVRTVGNVATATVVKDGELAAMLDGGDCSPVDRIGR